MDGQLHLEDRLRGRAFCGKVGQEYIDGNEGVTCRSCAARLAFFRGLRGLLIERGAWPLTPGAFALDTRFGRIVVNTTTALYGWIACKFTDPERTGHRGIVAQQGHWHHHFGVSIEFDPSECLQRFTRALDNLCPPDGWAPNSEAS